MNKIKDEPFMVLSRRKLIGKYHGPLMKTSSGFLWGDEEGLNASSSSVYVENMFNQVNWKWYYFWGHARRFYWRQILKR